MKFLVMFLLVSCLEMGKSGVSVQLEEAWSEVNNSKDIFSNYDLLKKQLDTLDATLLATEEQGEVKSLLYQKVNVKEKLEKEYKRVLGVQKVINEAATRDIQLLVRMQ